MNVDSPHSPSSGNPPFAGDQLQLQQTTNRSIFTSNKSKLDPNTYNYKLLLIINYLCLFVGSVSSSLLIKFYFRHKGSSRWVSTWIQSAGFPLLLLPIYLPYYTSFRQQTVNNRRKPFSGFDGEMLGLCFGVGLMLVVGNFCFSWGNSYLPMSTSALVLSSQLVFTLLLSVIIVKQKLTFLNVNCVVLLTLSCVLLALSSNGDRTEGMTKQQYFIGFLSTASAGLLFALYLPIMEKVYKKVDCYAKVVEMQFVMEAAATVVAAVGMAVGGGFREMREESVRVFDLGPGKYWVAVGMSVVTWQLCFMGTAGMVYLTTSLTGGICMTALMGMNVVGGVVVYGDEFEGPKVVATVMCLWGFCSYVYGMYVKMKVENNGGDENGDDDDDDKQQQQKSLLELTEIVTEDDQR